MRGFDFKSSHIYCNMSKILYHYISVYILSILLINVSLLNHKTLDLDDILHYYDLLLISHGIGHQYLCSVRKY